MHTPLAIASEAREPRPAHQAILPWLDMLRQLYPPSALLLVGAGSASSPWVQYLMATGHRNVTLIEADEATANRLKIATQEHLEWTVKSHVIGRHSAPTPFYTASLQTESGLLEPESLRSLWPNLKTTHAQTRQAIALAELQEDAETPANWLLVDCLPALPILQGAAQQLAAFDVIALRVALNDNALQASADELQTALQALGFRCLAIETGRHPAIGQALFVRDTAALAHQLQQQLAQQAQALAQAKATSDQLAAERQKLDQQLQQLKATAEKAQAAAAQATQHAQTAAEAQATAAASTAAATKEAEERAAQVQQLTQAKAAADKLAAERQQQIDQLQAQVKQTTEQAQAAVQETQKVQAAAAAAATASTTATTKQAEERAAQVQQLTQAKTAADKLATERQQQIDQLKEAAAQTKTATDKLAEEKQRQLEKLTEQLKLATSASDHTARQLADLRQQQEQLAPALSATNQLPNQWKAFAEAITTRMANTETALAQLSQQLAPERLPEMLLPKLNEKLLEQSSTQKDQLKEVETRLRSDFGKGLGNAVKQVEAFVSIQNYLTTGESISDFHGWPISPDIGLFLIEKIRERQYDLIIEFGSGTSTILFAKTLAHQGSNLQTVTATSTKKILSFEHDALYFQKNQSLISRQGLESAIDLQYAPLIEIQCLERTYLYYDCQAALKKLSQTYESRKIKVLVLVDGPPAKTCSLARLPALPILLQHLGKHELDIVLDDFNRPDEIEIIEIWRKLLTDRNLHHTEQTPSCEKGAILLSINNSSI